MFDKIIEKAIKDHCKAYDYLNDIKGLKILTTTFRNTTECYDGVTLVRFDVVCSCKARKYENNRVKFQVNIYDNPSGDKINTIGVYFDGTFYEG